MKMINSVVGLGLVLASVGISHASNTDYSRNNVDSAVRISASISDFEKLRLRFEGWLADIKTDLPFTSPRYLKDWVLGDWEEKQEDFKIISVHSEFDFSESNIPNAINIPFDDIFAEENIEKLDTMMTHIVYSDSAHTSVTASVLFNLLDMKAYNMKFDPHEWDLPNYSHTILEDQFSYVRDSGKDTSSKTFNFPKSALSNKNVEELIKQRYRSEVSEREMILPSDIVNMIVEKWPVYKDKYQIISVLNKKDYEAAHIPGAINIPIFNLMKPEQLKRIDPKKKVLIYCKSGNMAQVSTTLLNLLGYKAINIRYGMTADWKNNTAKK